MSPEAEAVIEAETPGAEAEVEASPDVPTEEPRGLVARVRARTPDLLRDVNFRHYWLAQTVSFMGDQVTVIALPLVAVLALDASAAQVGYLAAAATLPNLLMSLHAGAFIDRRGRRRQTMVVTDVLRAVLLATVPLAYVLDVLTLGHLYVVALLTGALTVLFGVATHSLFPAVVSKDRYVEANSLTRSSYAFSWIGGPSLGGMLVSALSAPYALVVDALSFLWSGRLLGTVSPEEPPGVKDEADGGVREGLRFVRRSPALFAKLLSYATLNFFYAIYFTLVFLFAARELDMAAGLIGLVLAAGAIGALFGTAVTSGATRRFGVGPLMVAGTIVYPAALVLTPLAPDQRAWALLFLVTAEFVSGFGLAVLDITGGSLQQALTPDRVRARAQGANMMVVNGSRPIGALAAGLLATLVGVRPALFIAVAGGVASVLFLLPSPIPRMRELPTEPDE